MLIPRKETLPWPWPTKRWHGQPTWTTALQVKIGAWRREEWLREADPESVGSDKNGWLLEFVNGRID